MKRLLSLFIVFTILLSGVPIQALAEAEETTELLSQAEEIMTVTQDTPAGTESTTTAGEETTTPVEISLDHMEDLFVEEVADITLSEEDDSNDPADSSDAQDSSAVPAEGTADSETPVETPMPEEEPADDPGHGYLIFQSSCTWEQAQEYCEDLGAHLAVITDEYEQEYIANLVAEAGVSCWIGSQREEASSSYYWVTHESFSYENWDDNEPSFYSAEDETAEVERFVGLINSPDQLFPWQDLKESTDKIGGFVCEWDEDYPYGETILAAGYCADDVTWVLYENGELVVSGTGTLPYYEDELNAPWGRYADQITSKTIHIETKTETAEITEEAHVLAEAIAEVEDVSAEETTEEHSYRIYRISATWEEAKAYCESLGGHLATITSSEEQQLITDMVTRFGYCCWLGASRAADSDDYNWVTGEDFVYTCWADGQPSCLAPDSDETYLGTYTNVKWNDFSGTTSTVKGFICEWDEADVVSDDVIAAGECGDTLTWTLKTDGTLVIEGSGVMTSWSSKEIVPWYIFASEISAVSLPDSLTSIGNYAFRDCVSLTGITIPETIASIGNSAFNGCSQLQEIAIPDSVTTIGEWAFSNCSALSSVTLSDTLTTMKGGAFYNCDALTEIHIPASITSVSTAKYNTTAYGPFGNCDGLKTFTLDDDATTIPANLFYGCTGLETLVIPEGVTSIGGSAFRRCTNLTSISLPETLATLETYAFDECSALSAIVIPASLEIIGNYAFQHCTALNRITISNGTTTIGAYAFGGCSALQSIAIPDSVTSIGNCAFSNCTALSNVTLSENLATLGGRAFYNCDALAEIHIPASITSVSTAKYNTTAYGPFGNCDGLKTFTLDDDATTIPANLFYGCTGLESVIIPDTVTSIGKYAFRNCTSLSSLTLSETLTTLESYAFAGCTALPAVSFPDALETIGSYAFRYCTSLSSVTMTEGVSTINNRAFSDCTSLLSIVFPSSVTSIGNYAFADCTALTSVTLSDSLESLGGCAFYNCDALTTIHIPSSLTTVDTADYNYDPYGPFGNCDGLKAFTPDDDATTIPANLFYGCTGLESVIIPDTVTSIGKYAFRNCTSLSSLTLSENLTTLGSYAFAGCTALPSVSFPDALVTIGSFAFAGCAGIDELLLPDSLKTIGQKAFQGTGITSIGIPASVTELSSSSVSAFAGASNLETVIFEDGMTNIPAYSLMNCSQVTEVSFPDSAVSIGSYAFQNCTGLTTAELPNSVVTINSYAFDGCTEMAGITLPESLTSIGYCAFRNCGNLTGIEFTNGLISIKAFAFSGCSNINEIILPDTVQEIHQKAFAGTGITTITVPKSITTLSTHTGTNIQYTSAFAGAELLRTIVFEDGLTQIPEFALQGVTQITDVVIPSSVVSIGRYAFDGCTALKRIDLSSVSTVSASSFKDCTALNSVYLSSKTTYIGGSAFNGCSSLTAIEIPAEVTSMSETSFNNCDDLTIYCYSGTAAHMTSEAAGYTFYLLDDHTHDYGYSRESEADCTKPGVERMTCSICGYNYAVVTEYSHDWSDWTTTKEATILTTGERERTCILCGDTDTEVLETLNVGYGPNTGYGLVHLTILDATTLEPISGANVYVTTEAAGEALLVADNKGKIDQVLPVGTVSLAIYADGYQTRSVTINVLAGENNIPAIGISTHELVNAEITASLMTEEEMIAAGIDITDPENQHLFKYELTLQFHAEFDLESLIFYIDPLGDIHALPGGGSDIPGMLYLVKEDSIEIPIPGETVNIHMLNEQFFLIVYGEVKWLKEIFDVELLVVNTSLTDTVEDAVAELSLPEGLSLAAMSEGEQSLIKSIGSIGAGESVSTHWYVRGDAPGDYDLSASVRGTMQPFGDSFSYNYKTEDALTVYAGNAMHLTYYVPDSAFYGEDYTVTIKLENVSDITLYDVTHSIKGVEQLRITDYYELDQETGEYVLKSTETIEYDVTGGYGTITAKEFNPGDVIMIEMTTNIQFQSDVMDVRLEQLTDFVDKLEDVTNFTNSYEDALSMCRQMPGFLNSVNSSINTYMSGETSVFPLTSKEFDASKKLYDAIDSLAASLGVDYGGKIIDAYEILVDSGVYQKLSLMELLTNGNKPLFEIVSEDEIDEICNTLELAEKKSLAEDFDAYDALRTAISLIPIRFLLDDAWVAESDSSTASIPYTIVTTPVGARYFGVENVSKYVYNILYAGIIDGVSPDFLMQILGIDFKEDTGYYDAVAYIKSVEEEAERFKITATGDSSFRAWIERADTGELADFSLSINNDTAEYSDGVLSFAGPGMLSVTPESVGTGVLCVEMEDGTVKRYTLDVVESHTCTSEDWVYVLEPTADEAGYRVMHCDICDQILDIEQLVLCETHSLMSSDVKYTPGMESAGLTKTYCPECGYSEYEVQEAYSVNGYIYCLEEGMTDEDVISFFDERGISIETPEDGLVYTGMTIEQDGKEYEIVIFGDVNSDSEINLFDIVDVQDYLSGDLELTDAQARACKEDHKNTETTEDDLQAITSIVAGTDAENGGAA